uniref:Cytochrome b561 bacterial/Ni-hydrogenase domain-containing protein n=1 Tax=Cyanothece sp. (strain PCC 7425 / ATCC 29141) TaxID=395961 RepID=B8HW75_CYAP4
MLRLHQKTAVRVFHALNLLSLWALIGSGLQIYGANPVFGGRQGLAPPIFLQLGGWLAGGRHLHFFFMWLFALNLLWYGVYLIISGHGRRRYPSPQDLKALRLTTNPKRITYAWHRLTLLMMILTLLSSLYTGLGMYKPVQFDWIVESFGNDWQALRIAHFLPVVMIVILARNHIGYIFKIGDWPLLQSIFVDADRQKDAVAPELSKNE